jgi:hypothetical protein
VLLYRYDDHVTEDDCQLFYTNHVVRTGNDMENCVGKFGLKIYLPNGSQSENI